MTVEWLDGEDADELPQPAPVGPGKRRVIWIVAIVAVLAVGVGIAVTQLGGDGKPVAAGAGSSVTPSDSGVASRLPLSSAPVLTAENAISTASGPRIAEVGHRVLGATSKWELFAYGGGTLVRVEMAAGIVHRTQLPEVLSGGGINFVVGPTSAILRPLDAVDGYLIRDGQAPRVLRGLLAQGGSIYPGPNADQVWVQPASDSPTTPPPRLYDLRQDRPVGTGPPAPQALGQPFMADGAGYLLYAGVGGVYDVRPDGVRRVTTGTIAAAGPRYLLAQECDARFHCTMVLIDTRSGGRASLGPAQANLAYLPGSVSPDGRFAVYSAVSGADRPKIHLVDLTTGHDQALDLTPSDSAFGTTPFAWDPDDDSLLVVDEAQTIRVVDPLTYEVAGLGLDLPPIDEIALRPATD